MAVLIVCPLSGMNVEHANSHGLTYLPELADAELPATLEALCSRVLIARRTPRPAALSAWRAALPSGPLILVTVDDRDPGGQVAGISVHRCAADADGASIVARAERLWALACLPRRAAGPAVRGRTVTLVGAGIVNLITALQLCRAGFAVRVFDACPDPRSGAHWTRYGCTSGGENARMFTVTEADVYHPFYGAGTQFGVPASAGGWQIRATHPAPDPAERGWLDEHRSFPGWLGAGYAADIYRFNREAGRWWQRLRRDLPELFEDVFLRDGIVRLYSSGAHVQADIARHRRLHLPIRVYSPAEAARHHPALADACATGQVAGAIEVPGFTVNVHDLIARLLSTLEREGAGLTWNTEISGVHWRDGRACGLETPAGRVMSDHYVLSPGVPIGDLLRGTAAQGTIQGVAGVWLTLPNVNPPLRQSLKIARHDHLANDTNITVAPDAIILGSGYGWTGADPRAIDPTELALVSDALHDTAQRFFPKAYAALESPDDAIRYCVRPWTASSLGVFEIHPAGGGGVLVVTGGHNTGGFAQAPAVAAAVLAALRGRRHRMHALYHPDRMRRVLR